MEVLELTNEKVKKNKEKKLNKIKNYIVDKLWDILEAKWDKCPNCDNDTFYENKCISCLYWFEKEITEYFEKIELTKIIERDLKSEKMRWIWQKIYLFTEKRKKIYYFNYPNRINNWKWQVEILYWKDRLVFNFSYEKVHNIDYQWWWEYDYFKVDLEEPENFDWNHYVISKKNWNWFYLDYSLAIRIAKELLNKYKK